MDFTPPLTYSPGSRRTARSTRPSTTSRRRYLTAAWGQWICLRFEGRVMTPCFLPLFSEPTSSQCLVATLWLSLTRVRTAGGWYKGTGSAGWFQDLISQKCDPNGRLLCCCCFLKPHYFNFAAVTVSLLQADWMDKCTHEFSFILFLPPPSFFVVWANIGLKASEEKYWKPSRQKDFWNSWFSVLETRLGSRPKCHRLSAVSAWAGHDTSINNFTLRLQPSVVCKVSEQTVDICNMHASASNEQSLVETGHTMCKKVWRHS